MVKKSLPEVTITFTMHGLVFDIRSFSVHDGPGLRKTVFFKGCPLRCSWCHNPESQNMKPEDWLCEQKTGDFTASFTQQNGRYMTAEEVMKEIVRDVPFFDESGGGVTLSGGEPLSQPAFAREILQLCSIKHIHTCLDTSGHAPWKDIEQVIPFTSLFLYDLKIVSPIEHKKHTGQDNQLILENLKRLHDLEKDIIIRIPLVRDITDNSENLKALRKLLRELPRIKRLDLLPYHNIAQRKYQRFGLKNPLTNMQNYSSKKATEIRDFFMDAAAMVTVGG